METMTKALKQQSCILAVLLIMQVAILVLLIVLCYQQAPEEEIKQSYAQEIQEGGSDFTVDEHGVNPPYPQPSYIQTIHQEFVLTDAEVQASAPVVEEVEQPYKESTLRMLATTIYLEAGAKSDLEGHLSVGWTIRNRLYSSDFNYNTYEEVILSKYPCTQFSVTLLDEFETLQREILEMNTGRACSAVQAARMVLEGENPYNFPDYICYFYGDADKRDWRDLQYYGTFGGNSFFYEKEG